MGLGECSFELELHILGYFISDVMKIAMLAIVKIGFIAPLFPLKSSNIRNSFENKKPSYENLENYGLSTLMWFEERL